MLHKLKKYHRDFEYGEYGNIFYDSIDIYTGYKYNQTEPNTQYRHFTLFRESLNMPVDFILCEYHFINLYKFAGWYFLNATCCEIWND